MEQPDPVTSHAVERHLLTSRDVGLTENALRALLDRALTGTGLDYHRWVALKTANDSGSPMTTAGLVRLLAAGLKIDEDRAGAVIDDLRARGDFDSTDPRAVMATAQGTALYQRLSADVQGVTAQMYAGLDADDLAVAYKVLATLTERANVLLAQAS